MGLPGVAIVSGLADVFWTALGLAIGTYLTWLLVAKRIRVYSEKVKATTLPDFFSNRFHDTGGFLVGLAAGGIVLFFVTDRGSDRNR